MEVRDVPNNDLPKDKGDLSASMNKQLTPEENNVLNEMVKNKDQDLIKAMEKNPSAVLAMIRDKLSLADKDEKKDDNEGLERALETIDTNKQALVKSSVNALLKMLQNLRKRPEAKKNRQHRLDNIIMKKYILDVTGAQEFMKVVGFEETSNDKGQKYLSIEQANINTGVLDHAITLLEAKASGKTIPKAEKKVEAVTVCQEVEMKTEVKPEVPQKCVKMCGFFGTKKFDGMCSVCYAKTQKKPTEQKKPAKSNWRKKLTRAMAKLKAVRAFKSAPRLLQKNKKRCWHCKRKVGITGIQCKCGFIFCGVHRYAEEHNCPYDHKAQHKKKLRKDNQQILRKKFETVDD